MVDKNKNTGLYNSGHYNSGNRNSGNRNSGTYNSGTCNSGTCNSGDRNSGTCNSGTHNSGHCNSGHYNSGTCNSGDYNSGNRNSGHYNSGHYNSGHHNSGHHNSGMFNTDEPKMRLFNKDSDMTYSEFMRKFGYRDISLPVCFWVYWKDMSNEEKEKYPKAKDTDGYLKTLSYKEAWVKVWEEATEDVKSWYKSLPNFDPAIFKEITGIDVEESLIGTIAEVKIGGKTYKAKIVE